MSVWALRNLPRPLKKHLDTACKVQATSSFTLFVPSAVCTQKVRGKDSELASELTIISITGI